MTTEIPAAAAAPASATSSSGAGGGGIPRSLFIFAILYGGMVCIAGVLGAKQVTLPFGLAVEAGIFPFLLLVVLSSAVAELHGRETANRLVRFGFIPLVTAIALIWLVIQLPTDPSMY
ncbi:MAG TPA: VUT family protein, partial [Allosphingosinicella sp.]|nr:VUT family protein [Allosphingosinicella sp.]